MKKIQSMLKKAQAPFIWFAKRSLFLKVVIVAIVVVSGWFIFSRISSAQNTSVSYQTAKAERGTLVVAVTASGNVISSNYVNVKTQANGVVKEVYVKDGDSVTEGQKIAEVTLDPDGLKAQTQAWANYLSALNNLESAKSTQYTLQADMFAKWDTFKELAESESYENDDGTPNYTNRALPEFHIPEKQWLAAEAKYKNQQQVISQAAAAVSSAWESYQLASPTITAPAAGVVTNITLVPGMLISSSSSSDASVVSSQRVAVVKNEGKPIVSLNFTEIDIPIVQPGQKATITFDSIKDATFTGVVATVDRIGSVSSNVTNYPVSLQLDVQDARLLPNMSAEASVITDTKDNVLLVPLSAVTTQDGMSYVRVMKNGKVTQVEVTIGASSDTQIQIKSGISEGTEVVTGTSSVSSGQSSNRTTSPFSTFGGSSGGGNVRMMTR